MKIYLYKNSFKSNYWIWTDHGQDMSHVDLNESNSYMDASTSVDYVVVGGVRDGFVQWWNGLEL